MSSKRKKATSKELKKTDDLSSHDKELLVAYRLFYNENYVPSDEAHKKMQAMVYILSHFGMDNGHYGFVWRNNQNGW